MASARVTLQPLATAYCLEAADTIVFPCFRAMPSDTQRLRALGARVRELRTARGWSQERLAEESSIHENHVRRIEGGTANPSYLVLLRIARALDVRLGKLVED